MIALDPLRAAAAVIPEGRTWLVGGAVRDALLGRSHPDYDLAVDGDVEQLARALKRATGGFAFSLSDAWGAWRISARDRSWQLDLTPLTGTTLQDDLARRDLTVNAIAQPLSEGLIPGAGRLIDPFGGLADIGAQRLRAVSARSFTADPLRILRLARLAVTLPAGFSVEPGTQALAQAGASGLSAIAGERVFGELDCILRADRAVDGVQLAVVLGATAVVLPELDALQGVQQSVYHDRDVYGHTLAALDHAVSLTRDPGEVFGADGQALAALLREPLSAELDRGQALRWGTLLHDIAKPQTRGVSAEGRVTFQRHDVVGAQLGAAILRRLRAGERLATHVAALTREHLRLGFLTHRQPLSARDIYGYLDACDPVAADVTVLSVADRLATRGRDADAAIESHLALARELIGPALAWHAHRPAAPIRGDRLAAALGIAPGPELGRLLAELTEAAYAGEISAANEAGVIAHAQARLASS